MDALYRWFEVEKQQLEHEQHAALNCRKHSESIMISSMMSTEAECRAAACDISRKDHRSFEIPLWFSFRRN